MAPSAWSGYASAPRYGAPVSEPTAAASSPSLDAPLSRPISAGITASLVGFSSSFAVVLTALHAAGATSDQAASGLLAASFAVGAGTIVLALRYRRPITLAWSTPGAALIAATGAVEGGWSAEIGAFYVVAGLILLTALIPALGQAIARIPASLAQAMLGGVLLPLCLAPLSGLVKSPWAVAPVIVVWLIALRFLPRWAVPLAFLAAAIAIGIEVGAAGTAIDPTSFLPRVAFTAPTFTTGAIVGLALPLFLVTMASQNVPGTAILRSFGYDLPWRPAMTVTGLGSALTASAGGPAINLAAITAALAASPDAHPDPRRRWYASIATGSTYFVLAAASSFFAVLVVLAPAGLIAAVAGLALFGAFGSAVQQAVADPHDRVPAIVTFLTAASGIAFFGISAAFWALVAGLVVRAALRLGRR